MNTENTLAITRSFEHGMYLRERESAPEGPPLLFVHGLGESGLCFEHLLVRSDLAAHTLLIPDLPGYGRSPWLEKPLSLAEQADYLADWLKSTGRGPAVLVGHSLGGVLVQLICERHPELAAACVDVDGNMCLDDCTFSSRAAEVTREEFLSGRYQRLCDTVYRLGRSDAAQRGYYASLRLCDPRQYHLNSCELMNMSRAEDLAGRLKTLPMPTVYIAGVPDGASRRGRDLLDQAQVRRVDISPAGHWPFLDQPDDFVRVLTRLLTDIRSR